MKRIIIFSVIAIVFAGFSSCKKESGKSKECDIISFKDGDKPWMVGSDRNITAIYSKGSNVSGIAPTIEVSENATVKPLSGTPQDFSNGKTVTYTVTAEDGKTTKVYTAQATVETN